jgi:site-specific recombinase XerD
MKSLWNDFQSPLAEGIKAYLASKRALGKRFQTEEETLRLLDRYLIGLSLTNIVDITPAILEAFLASRSRSRPRSYNHLLGAVRRLFDWLVIQRVVPRSPLRIQARPAPAKCQPFIFNRGQARQLLDAAAQLPDTSRSTQRGEICELAFLLMYGFGLESRRSRAPAVL